TAYSATGSLVNNPVENANACADTSEFIPSEIGAATSADGILIFDMPDTTGSFAYDIGGGGWEWSY
ncbi:MAG: hypothetical protein K2X97_14670, partial [Mycobacteriaceae bacterium]|nr:hypothetical protein [Mycobacteriaceae bacterium]